MTYSIPLSQIGERLYEQHDRDVERAVIHLVDRIGVANWSRRREALKERKRSRHLAALVNRRAIALPAGGG